MTTAPLGSISPNTVTLEPGIPGTVVMPTAVSGTRFVSFVNDNNAGLNAAGSAVSVRLGWMAWDGSRWYQICGASLSGGGTASTSSLGVSTQPSEIMVALTAVQPDAIGGSVVLSPTATVA